jgi:O-antigen/teichoic acid export membrane protein
VREQPIRPSGQQGGRAALARNTLWVALGQVLRVGVQAAYFILIARALGSREFGAYASVLAMVAVVAPFASMGSGNLLIKHVARTPGVFARYWGRALATTLVIGSALLGLVAAVGALWLPDSVPLALVLTIGAADLLFVRLVDVSAQAYQAHQWMSRTALLQVLVSPLRLLAATILVMSVPGAAAIEWGLAYLVSSAIGASIAVALANRELGRPRLDRHNLGSEFREGALFATTLAAQSSTNDLDKAMLARLSTLEATGVYAAAYKLVDVAFLPVSSLLVATYARFFQHGVQGVRAAGNYARRLLSAGALYGAGAAAGLYLAAPLVPAVLGEEYRPSVTTIRWLAVLPLLKSLHYFGADALTGAGHQGIRTVILVGIAGLNVLLNLWLIPLYSWRGAAIATIASDGMMGIAIWTAVWYLGRGDHQVRPGASPSPVEVGSR